jgi:shikimate dehydrogenase
VHLDVHAWEEASTGLAAALVVNTTPAGAADQLAQQVPDAPGALLDVVYSPWPTPLATAWGQRGGQVVGGLELLVQQAVRQVALMTGRTFDEPAMAERMREAGARALTERRQAGNSS